MSWAVALAPNAGGNYAALAEVLSRVGRADEALRAAEQALRLKSSLITDSYLYPKRVPIKDPAMLERHIATLRKNVEARMQKPEEERQKSFSTACLCSFLLAPDSLILHSLRWPSTRQADPAVTRQTQGDLTMDAADIFRVVIALVVVAQLDGSFGHWLQITSSK
jgi:hypothetical protein